MAYRTIFSRDENTRQVWNIPTATNVITVQPYSHVNLGMINMVKTVQKYLV